LMAVPGSGRRSSHWSAGSGSRFAISPLVACRRARIRIGFSCWQAGDSVQSLRQINAIDACGRDCIGTAPPQGIQGQYRAAWDKRAQVLFGTDPHMGDADFFCVAERVEQHGVEFVVAWCGCQAIALFIIMRRDLFRSDKRENIHCVGCFIRQNQLTPFLFLFLLM
jgi:hypothetical protein